MQNAGESSEQNMENVAAVVESRVVEPDISLEPAHAQIASGGHDEKQDSGMNT